jgi:hypothetical protein
MRSDRPYERAFVIQFSPEADPGSGRFEGRVEHVASGISARFTRADTLLAFLARMVAKRGDADAADESG